jgi:hypothetical protein
VFSRQNPDKLSHDATFKGRVIKTGQLFRPDRCPLHKDSGPLLRLCPGGRLGLPACRSQSFLFLPGPLLKILPEPAQHYPGTPFLGEQPFLDISFNCYDFTQNVFFHDGSRLQLYFFNLPVAL